MSCSFNFRRAIQIFSLFFIIYSIIAVWMWGVRKIFSYPLPADPIYRPYLGVTPETNSWLEPWQRWDTPQYQAIAERGYLAFNTALFTPPLYPMLMRLVAYVTCGNTLLAGMIISGITCLLCLVVTERLARLELDNDSDSFRAIVYLLSFPTSFFLFAAYTESLFLLACVGSLFAARKHKWILSGLGGAVAALTRSPGVLIAIPLTYAAWVAWRSGDRKGFLAPSITIAGALLFPLYVWFGLQRPPSSILTAVSRGGNLTIPGLNLVEALSRVIRHQLIQENLIELSFTLAFIVITFFIWKKLPRVYGIYALTFMLLFLTRMGSPQPLVSNARYVLEIFPAFLLFAQWGHKPCIHRIILYISWLGLLFFSAQFAIWGWVG